MSLEPATDPPFRVLERLVEDVFRLRRVMAQNEFDERLAHEHTFSFFIDTPVFRLFAEPSRYAAMVAAIPSLSMLEEFDLHDHDSEELAGDGPSLLQDALYANALLTGEYIFKLAAIPNKQPVLLSPEHASEIYAYISNLEGRSRALFRMAKLSNPSAFRELRNLLVHTEQKSMGSNASGWLASITHPIIQSISDAANSPMLAPSRLTELFNRQTIANAAQHLQFDEEIISPPFEVVADWARLIRQVKRRNKKVPSASAIEADAITLAQIELLNRDWCSTKRVHVLITSDRGLHRAYAIRKKQLEKDDPSLQIFYAMRDPRQYVPLLNVKAMGGGMSDPEIFKNVAESTKVFVSSFASTDSRLDVDFDNDPSSMPGAGAIRKVLQRRSEQDESELIGYEQAVRKQLGKIGRNWLEAVEAALVAKTDVISELKDRERSIWSDAFTREAMQNALRAQVTELGVSFEDLASTNTLLRHEIWAVGKGLAQHVEQTFKNQRHLASEFDGFCYAPFRGASLNSILTLFCDDSTKMFDAMREMAKNSTARAERLFLTGCLSLEIGAWAGAETLLQRAMLLQPAERLAREVSFFQSVARRLAATKSTYAYEYQNARTDLATLQREANSTFEKMRILNETLALDLSEIAFCRAAKMPVTEHARAAFKSWADLGAYQTRLLEPALDEVWRVASKQYILNTCNLAYWHYATGLQIPDRVRETVELALKSLSQHAGEYATDSVHGTIYPLLARYALGEEDRKELAAEIEEAISAAIDWDSRASIAFDLPYVDKAEFATIRHVLRFGPDR
jgi:hypothetical protein